MELLCHFRTHFEATGPDGRSDRYEHPAWVAAEFLRHCIHGVAGDGRYRASPTGVNGCGYAMFGIGDEDRYAVRCTDANPVAGFTGDQRVTFFQIAATTVRDNHLTGVNLL